MNDFAETGKKGFDKLRLPGISRSSLHSDSMRCKLKLVHILYTQQNYTKLNYTKLQVRAVAMT
eukprot:COSAG02_NODE_20258_length_840_cov_2.712551_1_plen_62_part_01